LFRAKPWESVSGTSGGGVNDGGDSVIRRRYLDFLVVSIAGDVQSQTFGTVSLGVVE
jgi:hypothetical protein